MPLPVAGEVNALATLHRQRGYAAIYPRPDAPKHTAPPSRSCVSLIMCTGDAYQVTERRSSNRTNLLSQYRPEYVIPQRCANAVVSRRKSMMDLVMVEQ